MTSPTHPTIVSEPPSHEMQSHFQSTPWASKFFSDPTLRAFTTESRIVKHNTGDTFISRTLATDDTIRAWQTFYRIPGAGSRIKESFILVSLGSGVNGHIDTCHGGFISLLLDEVTGTAADQQRPPGKSTMTAYLKVDYKKPVLTPSVILCRGWLEKAEGRKLWTRGTVEDGEGTVMATGEALFLLVEKVTTRGKL